MTYFTKGYANCATFSFFLLLSGLMAIFSYLMLCQNGSDSILLLWELAPGPFPWSLQFYLDSVSFGFLSVVSLISSSVFFYSLGYMSGDPSHESGRFSVILLLFVLSMFSLVIMPGLPGLFLGWDGLGLTSLFLVVYYQDSTSLSSGLITGLTNRVGDGLLLMALSVWFLEGDIMLLSLVLVAGFTKSAQFPFMSWLPAAMAAPTPVSSLVHSSTLVTAGVYLILRWGGNIPLFYTSSWESTLFCLISLSTLLLASLSALVEQDLKKIIALSTLSQVAVMMVALAVGFPTLALLHLYSHAFFKALLFMGAGVILHRAGTQDIRKMGALCSKSPVVSSVVVLSLLCLCGLFFTSGYYSKEAIYFGLFGGYSSSSLNSLFVFIFWVSLGLTMAYSLRSVLAVVSGEEKGASLGQKIQQVSPLLERPLLLMSVFALLGGFMFQSWDISTVLQPMAMDTKVTVSPLVSLVAGLVLGSWVNSISSGSRLLDKNSTLYEPESYFLGLLGFLKPLSTQGMSLTIPMGPSVQKSLDSGWHEVPAQSDLYFSASNRIFKFQNFSLWFILLTCILSIFVLLC